jgi:hypothetical protein
MIEGHIIFNAILYSIVIAYILYINFSAYYQTGTGFLRALVNLFQNWIFRTVYLLVVGFFSLDLFPYGGFVLAILLTIAFLNTNMLMYKKDVEESFTTAMNNAENKKKLPNDTQIQKMNNSQPPIPVNSATPMTPAPSTLGIKSNPSMIAPPAPSTMTYSNSPSQAMQPQQIGGKPQPQAMQPYSNSPPQAMQPQQTGGIPQPQVMQPQQTGGIPQPQVMQPYQTSVKPQPQAMQPYQTGVQQRK